MIDLAGKKAARKPAGRAGSDRPAAHLLAGLLLLPALACGGCLLDHPVALFQARLEGEEPASAMWRSALEGLNPGQKLSPPEAAPFPYRQMGIPLLYAERTYFEGTFARSFLGPLYQAVLSPTGERLDRVPLLFCRQVHHVADPREYRVEARFLWPLGHYQQKPGRELLTFFPVLYYQMRWAEDDPEKKPTRTDLHLYPFFFAGEESGGERYFALFPAAGRVRHVIPTKDYADFFLWPLYMKMTEPNYDSYHILFPFFAYWRGEKQRGWRLWPFFGRDDKDGKFEKYFALWPVFSWWKVGQDTKAPTTAWFVWPLYGQITNKNLADVTVLWPFFGCRREDRLVPDKSQPSGQRRVRQTELHAPWPLFSLAYGDKARGWKLFPLVEVRDTENFAIRSLLWPVFYRRVEKDLAFLETYDRVLLVSFRAERQWYEVRYPGGAVNLRELPPDEALLGATVIRRRWERWRLWPFVRVETRPDGTELIDSLALLPFREGPGWRELYGDLWTLFRREKYPDGGVRARALFSLLQVEHLRDFDHVRFFPLFDFWHRGREQERETELALLMGLLFQHRANQGEKWTGNPLLHFGSRRGPQGEWKNNFSLLGGLLGYDGAAKHKYRFLWLPF